jgi:membrane protease YdiL (CAAX protease family)
LPESPAPQPARDPLAAPAERSAARRAGLVPLGAVAAAALLAGYGNLFTAVAWHAEGAARAVLSLAGPLGLLAGVLAWHGWREGRPLAELGLHARRWRAGLAWGALVGFLMAVPPLLTFLLLAVTAGTPLHVAEVRGASRDALLVRLLVYTPVLVALVEEVAFRGFLLGRLRRALPGRPWPALALSALAFALWHVTVNLLTLGETNVASAGLASPLVAVAAGLLSVFVAGLVFGALHLYTGGLAAPVTAHWLVDALMLLALAVPLGALN